MIVSTQTMPIAGKIGEAEAIRLIAQAGFDAYDITLNGIEGNPIFEDNYKEYLASLKAVADEAGITCNQSHAPSSSRRDDSPKNQYYNEHIFDWLVRSLEAAAYLGAKNIIVHPINYMTYRGNEAYLKDMNMEFYRALAPHAKRVGIRIALENTGQMDKRRGIFVDSVCGSVREQIDYLETLGDDCFVACLDLGHCGLLGHEVTDSIRALGADRLAALHVHDNNFLEDNHTAPFCGKMEWMPILETLAHIGYRGDFTLECYNFFRGLPSEFLPDAAEYLCRLGRRMANLIEQKQSIKNEV